MSAWLDEITEGGWYWHRNKGSDERQVVFVEPYRSPQDGLIEHILVVRQVGTGNAPTVQSFGGEWQQVPDADP